MAIFVTCLGCGYKFDFEETPRCKYCGSFHRNPISADLGAILTSASISRQNRDFAKAFQEYRRAINMSPHIGDSYWGAFLCEYSIADEKKVMDGQEDIVTESEKSVFENQNLAEALKWNPEKKEEWSAVAEAVEKARSENAAFRSTVRANDYHLLILADDRSAKDSEIADRLYDELHTRINVFYPPRTLRAFPPSAVKRLTSIACGEIPLVYALFSEDTPPDTYLTEFAAEFAKKRNPSMFFVVGTNDMYVPMQVQRNRNMITADSQLPQNALENARVMGKFSMADKNELRSNGRLSRIQSNPSPIINH